MTETEWLACTDPPKMLDFLRGKTSDRKLRLFAVACCWRVWHLLTDERSRRAVQVAERFAEGLVGKGELATSRNELRAKVRGDLRAFVFGRPRTEGDPGHAAIAWAAAWDASREGLRAIGWEAARDVARAVGVAHRYGRLPHGGQADQASLLRDIFGPLPFRPVTIDPFWLAWDTGTVVKLAQAIYSEPAFDRLPVVADALEDAGCDNDDILSHLRGPSGPHVRGCWVVDLLLGKE
jgi:hypothetical protein